MGDPRKLGDPLEPDPPGMDLVDDDLDGMEPLDPPMGLDQWDDWAPPEEQELLGDFQDNFYDLDDDFDYLPPTNGLYNNDLDDELDNLEEDRPLCPRPAHECEERNKDFDRLKFSFKCLRTRNKFLLLKNEELTKQRDNLKGDYDLMVDRMNHYRRQLEERKEPYKKWLKPKAAATGGQNGGVGVAVRTGASGGNQSDWARYPGPISQQRNFQNQVPRRVGRPQSQEPMPSTSRGLMGPPRPPAPRPRPTSSLTMASAASRPQQANASTSRALNTMRPPPAPGSRPFAPPRAAGPPGIPPRVAGPPGIRAPVPLARGGPPSQRPRFSAAGPSAPRLSNSGPLTSGAARVRPLPPQRQPVGRPSLPMNARRPMPKSVKERALENLKEAAAIAAQPPPAIASTSAQAIARMRAEDAAMNAAQANASFSSDQLPITNGGMEQEAAFPPPPPGFRKRPLAVKIQQKNASTNMFKRPRGRPPKFPKLNLAPTTTTPQATNESQGIQGRQGLQGPQRQRKKPNPVPTGHEPQFNCDLCEERFVFLSYLRRHMKNVHKLTDDDIQHLQGFGCGRCGGIFPTNHELYEHMAKVHGFAKKKRRGMALKPAINGKALKRGRRGGLVPTAKKLAKAAKQSVLKQASGQNGLALPKGAPNDNPTPGTSQPPIKTTKKRGRPSRKHLENGTAQQNGQVAKKKLKPAPFNRGRRVRNPVNLVEQANPPPEGQVDLPQGQVDLPQGQDNPPQANPQEPHRPAHYLTVCQVKVKGSRDGTFKCACGHKFNKKNTARTHVQRLNNGKVFKCKLCSKGFVAHNVLKTHYKQVHRVSYKSRKLACHECGRIEFVTKAALRLHRKTAHLAK